MIYIGQHNNREQIIARYMQENGLHKVVLFGDPLEVAGAELMHVPYKECIKYSYYYKYLEFTDKQTLFVWNDCLKTQKRNCLEYNCIRHCAEQTSHHLIFNTMPLIEFREDFMILYTLQEPNPFVKVAFSDLERLENVDFSGWKCPHVIATPYEATEEQKAKYEQVKAAAIAAVKRDPNIIPRRCLKYAESLVKGDYDSKAVFLPRDMRVTVSDLPVDGYFFEKLINIQQEIVHVKSKI